LAWRSGDAGGQETIVATAAGLIEWPAGSVAAGEPVAGRPGGVALGGGFVWVTDSVNDKLLKIDLRKHLVIDQIPVGADPTGVVVGGGAVWVANSQVGTISRVNLEMSTVVQTLRRRSAQLLV
jgi:DNA-binding beta-propeller fold protein YncE